MAHITGGGLPENLPRVLPEGCTARIDLSSWRPPAVFEWLQQGGNVEQYEMLRTFNCGVGMVLVVAADQAKPALSHLASTGIDAWPIGDIVAGTGGVEFSE